MNFYNKNPRREFVLICILFFASAFYFMLVSIIHFSYFYIYVINVVVQLVDYVGLGIPVMYIILFDVIYAKQILAQSIIEARNCALCKAIEAQNTGRRDIAREVCVYTLSLLFTFKK